MATIKGALLLALVALAALAAPQKWTIYKPGNTGIGGNQVESFAMDPQGRPWVGARYPIQQDGGVAMFDGTKWTNYSTIDGLMPSEYVYATAFAPDGTRWHGTDHGLVHHFGDHFTLYNSTNSPLPRNFIRSIQVDSGGAVWMVYWDPGYIFTGVAKFDGTNWTIWPHNSAMGLGDTIMLDNLVIGNDGRVWVGNNSTSGVSRWNGTTWAKVRPGTDAVGSFNPFKGRDGRVWVMCGTDIRVLDGTQWVSKPYPPSAYQDWMSLHVLPNGTYYVGSWDGLLAYNSGSSWKTMNTPAPVIEIHSNEAGELWWSSLKRLYKFVDWSRWLAFHSGNTGLTEYFTNSLAFDLNGKLWVGTSGGGACSFDGSVWRGFNPYNDGFEPWALPTDYVPEVMGASDGSIWAALSTNGVARYDGTSWKHYSNGFTMDSIAEGPGGAIVGTWNINTAMGYSVFNGTEFVRTDMAGDPYYSGEPYDVMVDSAGTYLCTATGLLTNESGTWLRKEMNFAGGSSPTAFCVAKGPDGTLWVGSEYGLARRHNDQWTLLTKDNSGIPANLVTSIAFRPDGLMAVGAFNGMTWPYYGGVALYDGTTWRKFTYANSPIQHEQVDDVHFDPVGNLWIVSQSEGIAKIDLSGISGAPELSSVKVTPTEFAGGLNATGTVTLAGPAPTGGVTVSLQSGSPLASVPTTVTVPAGKTKANFKIATKAVATDTVVSLSATANGVERSASAKLLVCQAGYYGQYVPLSVQPGETIDVSITFRNMGTATWTSNTVKLVSISPTNNLTWGINRLTLNPLLSTKPDGLGNFMGTITAPTNPGVYTFQWRPLLVGSGFFGEPSQALKIVVGDPPNRATFQWQTVPSTVKAGAYFTATIVMRNTGTSTWTSANGFGLISQNPTGNLIWGRGRVPVKSTATVAPNTNVAFAAQFKAPSTPGTYNFQWKMHQNGVAFGDPSQNVSITVAP